MLSRVAESIYWMSRYVERAENNARFLDVNFNFTLDSSLGLEEHWQPLLSATASSRLFQQYYDKPTRENVIFFIAFDRNNASSIYSCIISARENARVIRENLTKETWEEINDLYLMVKEGASKDYYKKRDPRKFFDKIKKGCQLLLGMAENTVSRTEGWHFGKIGQYLERADNTSRILDVKYHILLPSVTAVGSPVDIIQWASLLKSVTAYNMYRRIYGKIIPLNIARFLILDKYFPRAIFYCLRAAEFSLHEISGGLKPGFVNIAEKKMGIVRSELEYEDMDDIFASGLHEFLDQTQVKLIGVSNAIHKVFFSYGIK